MLVRWHCSGNLYVLTNRRNQFIMGIWNFNEGVQSYSLINVSLNYDVEAIYGIALGSEGIIAVGNICPCFRY